MCGRTVRPRTRGSSGSATGSAAGGVVCTINVEYTAAKISLFVVVTERGFVLARQGATQYTHLTTPAYAVQVRSTNTAVLQQPSAPAVVVLVAAIITGRHVCLGPAHTRGTMRFVHHPLAFHMNHLMATDVPMGLPDSLPSNFTL